jgi:uncharacterized iron-regulated membrane protein
MTVMLDDRQTSDDVEVPEPDDGAGSGRGDGTDANGSDSRRWRTVWRIHFYSGVFAFPFILLMAVTGLVILYTQPIQDWTEDEIRTVTVGETRLSYDEQAAAVEAAYDDSIVAFTPPTAPDRASIFSLEEGGLHALGTEVFVDPYTGEILGDRGTGSGIIGLANRLHGFLNVDTVTVKLPSVAALWDGEAVMRDYVVFDLVLEILGVWTLVLVVSGLFLWWPRRSRRRGSEDKPKSILGIRRGVTGRARWRDLHGLSGVLLLGAILLTLVSGLAWSTYWGQNFASLGEEVSPGNYVEPPLSELGTRGDLDRLGNKINWNSGDFPIPESYAPTETDGTQPLPMRLDDVVTIAESEGMKPGYTVYLPANEVADDGTTTYGSFTLSNSWPRKTGEARDLFLDQFTGETLAEQPGWGYEGLNYAMDTLVSTHMGTQLGIFSRILMTALCVLSIWSVFSAMVMYTKRRRKGTIGLPRRPLDVRLGKQLIAIAVLLGFVFPQWGVIALMILGIDRFLIRRVPRLRVAFGQR